MRTSILHLMKKHYPDTASQDTAFQEDITNIPVQVQENDDDTSVPDITIVTTAMTKLDSVSSTTIETTTATITDTSTQAVENIDVETRPVKSTSYSSQSVQSNPPRSSVKLEELILAEELRLLESDDYIGALPYP